MAQINVLYHVFWQIGYSVLASGPILQLFQAVGATKGLLIPWYLTLFGPDDGSKLDHGAELCRDFSLVDAFYILIEKVLLLDVVELFKEAFLR